MTHHHMYCITCTGVEGEDAHIYCSNFFFVTKGMFTSFLRYTVVRGACNMNEFPFLFCDVQKVRCVCCDFAVIHFSRIYLQFFTLLKQRVVWYWRRYGANVHPFFHSHRQPRECIPLEEITLVLEFVGFSPFSQYFAAREGSKSRGNGEQR